MATRTTVGNVIDTALGLAQLDTSLRSLARTYYNFVIRSLSGNYNLPFYRKDAAVTALVPGQTEFDLPADYTASDYCFLISADGNKERTIEITSKRRVDMTSSTARGLPRLAYIDQDRNKIVFDTSESSSSGRSFRLTYFREGLEIDVDGGDDADEIDFYDDNVMMMGVKALLREYGDDERQLTDAQRLDKEIGSMLRNAYDEDNDSTVHLATGVHKQGRRQTRGGGNFNF
jgi:hypothetical protein